MKVRGICLQSTLLLQTKWFNLVSVGLNGAQKLILIHFWGEAAERAAMNYTINSKFSRPTLKKYKQNALKFHPICSWKLTKRSHTWSKISKRNNKLNKNSSKRSLLKFYQKSSKFCLNPINFSPTVARKLKYSGLIMSNKSIKR